MSDRYYVQPGVQREAAWRNAPSGRAADITLEVLDASTGVVVRPEDGTGVQESVAGATSSYSVVYISPLEKGLYFERWRDNSVVPTVVYDDELEVTSTLPATPGITGGLPGYASTLDLREYAPELATRSEDELNAALLKAERDIDEYAGFVVVLDSGRKFDLDPDTGGLDISQAAAITRATCAQARFRIYMGPAYFVKEVGYGEVGGDIPVKKPPRYGPEMRMEFPAALRKLTGRLS